MQAFGKPFYSTILTQSGPLVRDLLFAIMNYLVSQSSGVFFYSFSSVLWNCFNEIIYKWIKESWRTDVRVDHWYKVGTAKWKSLEC